MKKLITGLALLLGLATQAQYRTVMTDTNGFIVWPTNLVFQGTLTGNASELTNTPAGNVFESEAGTGITIATNGYLYTISSSAGDLADATNYTDAVSTSITNAAVSFGANALFSAGATSGITASNANQLVTFEQLQQYSSGSETYFMDNTTDLFGSVDLTGTIYSTNQASSTLGSQSTNLISGYGDEEYLAVYVTDSEFTQVNSGAGTIELYCYENAAGSVEITAEFYVVTNGVEGIEFTPAPAPQTVPAGATPTKLVFTSPLTDYVNANGFKMMAKIKVKSLSIGPDVGLVTGGSYPSHMMFSQPASAYATDAELLAATNNLNTVLRANITNHVTLATNNAAFTQLTGVYRTMWVPAGAMIPDGAAPAALGTNTQGVVDAYVLDFDDSAAVEAAQFVWRMPEVWDRSTVKVKFVWTAGGSAGNVVWGIQAVAVGDDDAMGPAFGTPQEVTDGWTAANDQMTSAATSALTVGGTPALGDVVYWYVYRDGDAAGDTFTGDASLLGVTIQYKESTTEPSAW